MENLSIYRRKANDKDVFHALEITIIGEIDVEYSFDGRSTKEKKYLDVNMNLYSKKFLAEYYDKIKK